MIEIKFNSSIYKYKSNIEIRVFVKSIMLFAVIGKLCLNCIFIAFKNFI